MSEKRVMRGPKKGRSKRATAERADSRVVRTRNALGDAIVELMQKKPFEAITVAELLERARVSRSTFYEHFRDKDDLFLSDADDFFGMMAGYLAHTGEKSNRVAPVQEMLAHVKDMSRYLRAVEESGKLPDIMELGEGHMARSIETRLKGMAPTMNLPAATRALKARALAGAFSALMLGWLRGGMRESPVEIDRIFHALVWNGVGNAARNSAQAQTEPKQSSKLHST